MHRLWSVDIRWPGLPDNFSLSMNVIDDLNVLVKIVFGWRSSFDQLRQNFLSFFLNLFDTSKHSKTWCTWLAVASLWRSLLTNLWLQRNLVCGVVSAAIKHYVREIHTGLPTRSNRKTHNVMMKPNVSRMQCECGFPSIPAEKFNCSLATKVMYLRQGGKVLV